MPIYYRLETNVKKLGFGQSPMSRRLLLNPNSVGNIHNTLYCSFFLCHCSLYATKVFNLAGRSVHFDATYSARGACTVLGWTWWRAWMVWTGYLWANEKNCTEIRVRALTELSLPDVRSGRLIISVSLTSIIYKTPGNARGQSPAKCGKFPVQLWQCERHIHLAPIFWFAQL